MCNNRTIHINCTISFHFSATAYMTKFKEFKRFNNSLQAFWKFPKYVPDHFQLSIQCKYICKRSYDFYDKAVLPPSETTFTFSGLAPGSQCDFTLKAVYNPASIDHGIQVSYLTLPSSKIRLTKQVQFIPIESELIQVWIEKQVCMKPKQSRLCFHLYTSF